MDILTVYQFCTFGGVERVLLNRAMAFKEHNLNHRITVAYLDDCGAVLSFSDYIRKHQLEDYLHPVIIGKDTDSIDGKFDLTLIIDTPQKLDRFSKVKSLWVECHTPYQENRRYLSSLPKNVKRILVPSASFKSTIQSEFKPIPPVSVLPNCVPQDFFQPREGKRYFSKKPLIFLSRLDELKNFREAFEVFESVQNRKDVFQIIIGRGESLDQKISAISSHHLTANTLARENIAFDDVPALTTLARLHCGVFVSCSKGESFGLSAAEFMCGQVPVLLSDIPAHRELVEQDEHFLYPLGNIIAANEKLNKILDDWEESSSRIALYAKKFHSAVFINAWTDLIHKMNRT